MADDALERLKKVREELEDRRRRRDRLEGRRDALLAELKVKYGLTGAEEAAEEADRMEADLAERRALLEKRVADLEAKMKETGQSGTD